MLLDAQAVMFFVDDPDRARSWYAEWLDLDPVELAPDYFGFRVGAVEIWFHQADAKVPAGASGTVTYWRVENLAAALARAETLGGACYRGPLAIEDGQAICQILDPFGNLFGLIGPEA